MKRIGASVVVMILFLTFIAGRAPSTEAEEYTVIIPYTASESDAVMLLKKEGFVRSEILFKILFAVKNFGRAIEAGEYVLSKNLNSLELVQKIEEPTKKWIALDENLTKDEITTIIGDVLNWDEEKRHAFKEIHTSMQWNHFNKKSSELFASKFNWTELDKITFTTISTKYREPEYDFFEGVYEPDAYLISKSATLAEIANQLNTRIDEKYGSDVNKFLIEKYDEDRVVAVANLVKEEIELLPDLVPLPARDVQLVRTGGGTHLLFSTTYWNNGEGPLELIADPKTQGIKADIERDVFQRIYKTDGTWRDKLAGTFLWHDEHLHYHFADFVDYTFEPVETGIALHNIQKKATFCVRDVEHTKPETIGSPEKAAYVICGKERQGVSVGWGDTYFYTYVDQSIDVSGIASGKYKLTFLVNPKDLFEETTRNNNIASAVIEINMEEGTAEVVEELFSLD